MARHRHPRRPGGVRVLPPLLRVPRHPGADRGGPPEAGPIHGLRTRHPGAPVRPLVEYQTNGANKLSWEQWRNKYITIAGNRSRGAAYEQALRELLGYPATAPRSVKGATGIDRRFDILDEDKQLGIELKSGTTVKPDQLAKDTKLVRSGWTVKYIFGAEPDAETIAALTKAGIQWQVIHSTSVVR